MNTETRTYYLTRYALSTGIREMSGKPYDTNSQYVAINGLYGQFRLGSEVFESLPEAIADAEQRRMNKIESLRNQIARLENLFFEEHHDR